MPIEPWKLVPFNGKIIFVIHQFVICRVRYPAHRNCTRLKMGSFACRSIFSKVKCQLCKTHRDNLYGFINMGNIGFLQQVFVISSWLDGCCCSSPGLNVVAAFCWFLLPCLVACFFSLLLIDDFLFVTEFVWLFVVAAAVCLVVTAAAVCLNVLAVAVC